MLGEDIFALRFRENRNDPEKFGHVEFKSSEFSWIFSIPSEDQQGSVIDSDLVILGGLRATSDQRNLATDGLDDESRLVSVSENMLEGRARFGDLGVLAHELIYSTLKMLLGMMADAIRGHGCDGASSLRK